jgi:hypothetical protein
VSDITKVSIDLYSTNNDIKDKQKQNTMNTVTFYKHNVRIQEFTFATEKEAVDCMLRHASEKGLEVSPNYDEAYSEGNKPELLIIVNEA